MRPSALFWLAWALSTAMSFWVLERAALRRGAIEDTLTGTLKAVMLVHPWLFVLVPTLIVGAGVGIALHLLVEALKP